jgi:1-deoxy-D-xylulose-5-phosphate synthase
VKIKAQPAQLTIGQAEVLREGSNVMIWALGPMVQEALVVAERLATEEGLSVGVVNARFAKPLDRTLLLSQAACIPLLVTMEDHAATGGFGSAVLEALQEADSLTPVERIGWPDKFVEHGSSVEILRAGCGLSTDDIVRRIKDRAKRLGPTPVEAEA